jgi:glycosyltransferase involved in cell wall biosynthesis
MNILVISTSIGDTAPGIVFESYINALKKEHSVDIITTKNVSNIEARTFFRPNLHHRLRKFSVGLFSFDFFDFFLSLYISRKQLKTETKYDLVFSMISLHNFFPLYLGYLLKAKTRKKWLVYSVDAIPPPRGWSIDGFYRRGLVRMLKYFSKRVDKLFFSNELMLKYQLDVLGNGFKGEGDVIYTPSDQFFRNYKRKEEQKFVLLYTGGVYDARKPDELIRGFHEFQKNLLNSELYFIGTNPLSIDLSSYDEYFKSKVHFVPFTFDLTSYYELADVLIDIDAAIERDVFLSSKLIRYLSVDRPILCITGKFSPSKQLFQQVNTMYFCSHDSSEIVDQLSKIYLEKEFNFSSRKEVLRDFLPTSILKKIQSKFYA